MAKQKKMSRPQLWAQAAARADGALGEALEALQELVDLRSGYEEWKDNLPENLQQSPLGEKLEAVCDLDLDQLYSEVEQAQSIVQEACEVDLPLGFGRD